MPKGTRMDSVILEMATFKSLSTGEDARAFLGILESAGGIFIPEQINDRDRCAQGSVDNFVQSWLHGPLVSLDRRRLFEVSVVFTNPERVFAHLPGDSPKSRTTTRGTLVPQFRFREGP